MSSEFGPRAFAAALMPPADHLIDLALAEDLGERGDITTQAVASNLSEASGHEAEAVIIAKSAGVVAGIEAVRRVFQKARPPVRVEVLVPDAESVVPRTVVTRLHGAATAILTHERTALNFLQQLSGIATLTRRFVQAVAGTRATILDTRKTTPGWRLLEKYAVRCGGGANHRLEEMRNAVALVAGRISLEASGNVNLDTVDAIAATGVDFISIGALTHSASAMDFSLLLQKMQ